MDIAKGSVIALGYRIVGSAFWAAIGIITARTLSVEDRGTYAIALLTALTIGAIFGSFSSSFGYYITNQKRPPAEVASNGLLLAAGVSLAILASTGIASLFVGDGNRLMLWLVGLAIVPNVLQRPISASFIATNQIGRHGLSTYGQAYMGTVTIAIWVVLLDNRTAPAAIGAWAVGEYIALAVAIGLGRSWWGWLLHHRPNPVLMRAVVGFGLVTGMAGVLGFVNARISQLLVGGIEGSEGAGIYASALPVAEGLGLFAGAIAIASYANIGRLGRRESADLAARSIRHSLLIVGLGAVTLVVFAPVVISVLFGDRYLAADQALRILSVGALVDTPWTFFATFFVIQLGRPKLVLIFAAATTGFNIALSSILINQIGFEGGAWATATSQALRTCASAALFMHVAHVPLRDLILIRRADLQRYVDLAHRAHSVLRRAAA
jgi:O-antigen/teichoic acid export membrane protein